MPARFTPSRVAVVLLATATAVVLSALPALAVGDAAVEGTQATVGQHSVDIDQEQPQPTLPIAPPRQNFDNVGAAEPVEAPIAAASIAIAGGHVSPPLALVVRDRNHPTKFLSASLLTWVSFSLVLVGGFITFLLVQRRRRRA